jgi:CubicO group peptidase (beta-lactamase class C family)
MSIRCRELIVVLAGFVLAAGMLLGAELSKPLATALQPFVDQGQLAGAVAFVADREHVLDLEAVGRSDLANGRTMRTDDLFWIASMTKPMTAACVLMLADAGKLSVDDPVEKFLPEFKNQWLVTEAGADRKVLGAAAAHLAGPAHAHVGNGRRPAATAGRHAGPDCLRRGAGTVAIPARFQMELQ